MKQKHLRSGARAVAVVVAIVIAFIGGTVAHANTPHTWPIGGSVVRGFDPPANTYGAGHRGIDIAGPPGTTVVAPADGVVTFVGVIDYVPMVTVTHADGVRTTYQPVSAVVKQGDKVLRGQAIGVLQGGHGSQPSLHFGVLLGTTYLDPLAWLGAPNQPIRLLPDDAKVPPRATTAVVTRSGGWPVAGTVTSGYGWRTHPILGTRAFHDGIDIGAACGTPVASPWAGVVTTVGTSSTLGRYVRVTHDGGLVTTFAHLSIVNVAAGNRLEGGQQLGLVGTTGRSTGCHLHFGASRDGVSIDPKTLLPVQ